MMSTTQTPAAPTLGRSISDHADQIPDRFGGSPARVRVCGAISVAVLSTAYTMLYWNRFLAPSAGFTFFYLAEQTLKGRLPYRDIFFVVPPLQIFKLAAVIRLFGDNIFVARTEAAIERTILALLLYFILTRFCRAGSAMLTSFFTIVLLSTDFADAMINYHIDSAFWAVAAAACTSIWIRARSPRAKILSAASAGFFAALSILTKQTTGAGVIAALAITGSLIAWRQGKVPGVLRFIVPLFAGWLTPIAIFTVWLVRTGSFQPFLHAIFTANTSKGRLLPVLFRPIMQVPTLFLLGAALTPVCAGIVRLSPRRNRPESLGVIGLLFGSCAVVLGLVVSAVWRSSSGFPSVLHGLQLAISHVTAISEMLTLMLTTTGSAFLFIDYGQRYFKRALTEREAQIWMVAAVSLAVAYMMSLSWAIYSPMAAPGIALIAGLALDRLQESDGRRFSVLAAMVLWIAYTSAHEKLMQPFNWMGWAEPSVSEARFASSLPKLAGLRISQPTLSLAEGITRVVQDHTKPGDSLVVYPYLPMFYTLTELNPPTYGFNYWLDVCPDVVCMQDAASLRAHPPDAIVYMVQDAEVLKRFEAVFRSGRPSGSREMARAIEDIAHGYQKRLSGQLPGSQGTIEVYTRR